MSFDYYQSAGDGWWWHCHVKSVDGVVTVSAITRVRR